MSSFIVLIILFIKFAESGSTDTYGGQGGSPSILEASDSDTYITRVCVRYGGIIDGIGNLIFDNGESTGFRGGNGGTYFCYTVPDGECITSISVRYGAVIDQLKFTTSMGSTSPTFGGNGGTPVTVNADDGECLTKIVVRAGMYLDNIGFYFNAMASKAPTQSPVVLIWSPWYGGNGGTEKLLEVNDYTAYIKRVCLKQGAVVLGIGNLLYNNDETTSMIGNSGIYSCWYIPNDECITSISLRYGAVVDQISFKTSKGTTSPIFGGSGGTPITINADEGKCLSKIGVRSGGAIDKLRFYFTPLVTFKPTTSPLQSYHWTLWYGGHGGSPSVFGIYDKEPYITRICVRHGSVIYGIGNLHYTNGETTEMKGGNGGNYGCYNVPNGECITSVVLRFGAVIDQISFKTSKGSSSPIYGGNGGTLATVTGNGLENQCLKTIRVRSGGAIDALGFFFDVVNDMSINAAETINEEPLILPLYVKESFKLQIIILFMCLVMFLIGFVYMIIRVIYCCGKYGKQKSSQYKVVSTMESSESESEHVTINALHK